MTTTANDPPLVSVVVCSYGGADLLRGKLEGLCAQTLARQRYEVLVVEDGSAAGEAELVRAFAPLLPVSHARPPRPGRLSARNHGVLLATGELVLFLDDDTVPTPGLLEAHCAAHRRFPAVTDAVLGTTRIGPSVIDDPLVRFVTEVEGFPVSCRGLRDGELLDFTFFWAARSSCKRALLVEHGPFSPDLDPACADVDLAYRAGLRVAYCPEAVATRASPMDFEAHRLERHRHGVAQRELASRYPSAADVQQWCGVARAAPLWRKVALAYPAIVRSARELDRLVRLRGEAGLARDPSELALLHRAYWTAFRVTTASGAAAEGLPRGAVSDRPQGAPSPGRSPHP